MWELKPHVESVMRVLMILPVRLELHKLCPVASYIYSTSGQMDIVTRDFLIKSLSPAYK